jgi:hydrogenase expression/formation protein HypE
MGIQEICRRSGTGAVVFHESLPIREETRLLCGRYGMDPLGLLSSGVFLFTAARPVADQGCRLLEDRGIPAVIIGEILETGEGVWLRKKGVREPLAFSEQDEIVKLRTEG